MDQNAEAARLTAILHMAFDFASMSRVFEKGSKAKFLKRVRKLLPDLASVATQGEFEALHARFCTWGRRSLRTSHGGHQRASYGQVAKTLNVVLKVVVSYCGMPDQRQAARLLPWLHPAIDNQMMGYLRQRYRDEFPRGIKGISEVDRVAYMLLVDMAAQDARENYSGGLVPVQWEDVVWVEVNRKG